VELHNNIASINLSVAAEYCCIVEVKAHIQSESTPEDANQSDYKFVKIQLLIHISNNIWKLGNRLNASPDLLQ
jgi:hypothetical protein